MQVEQEGHEAGTEGRGFGRIESVGRPGPPLPVPRAEIRNPSPSGLGVLWVLCGSVLVGGCTHAKVAPAQPPTPPTVAPESVPRIFLHSGVALARNRARWKSTRQNPAVTHLLDEAARALAVTPFSVTEKTELPPSGDKHDYLSLAPYAWPDPRRPDGLPYVIRDGRINPERDRIADHAQLARVSELAETLGLAYFFTGNEAYAAHAARLVRVFFLDAATRMNPHLAYAQLVRGKPDGRPAGIIDGAGLPRLVDALALFSASASFTAADRDGMTAWLRAYLTWLRETELGVHEGQARNNHGTWYDVQVASLALGTGQAELAAEVLAFARKRRIGRTIEPDGSQPAELSRTRSWHYAVYHLEALVLLANLGETARVGLWRYQTPDGRSIRKAIDWLLPFALGEKPWTTPALDGFRPADLVTLLREAAAHLGDQRLAQAAQRIGVEPSGRASLFLD